MTPLELIFAAALAASLALCAWLWARPRRTAPHMPVAAPLMSVAASPKPVAAPPTPARDELEALAHPLFQAAASALDAGIVVVDCARAARFLNHHAEELLGVAPEMVGQSLIAVLRDHQADALVAEVLRDGEPRELAMQPISSGRTLRLRCTPLALTGRSVGAMLLIRDITQISMLERSRRDLVANVSHELRTPLASLKLLVETVQSEPPPEVSRRMLGQMAQEIDAVTQLVDELHELSQIESGRVTLKLAPQTIRPVVERALERIRPQADRKQIAIVAEICAETSAVLMDADRIGQVLLNLLHNAVKFTSAGGVVTVRVDLDLSDGGPGPWLRVSVSDTGIGIPPQDLPRIFERFYKVDRSRTRNAGGTGLGLAIAKHLIEGHGGRLWADSAEGRGSTFSFTLPVA
jgi:two-component system, OmpR family, phosphate regulon sensor histidine kinase PhoR